MDIPFNVRQSGLYFTKGDFFIDAITPVSTCIITHAHADHACFGHKLSIATPETIKILQHRFGRNFPHKIVHYGEKFKLGSLWVSLHPAGYILGSSQVRVEDSEIVSVISFQKNKAMNSLKIFRYGINIPSGTTNNDLLNFKNLIDQYQAKKCIIVGDLIHSKNGLTDTLIQFFADFLNKNKVEIHLVLGNHDLPLIKNIPVNWPLFLHKNFLLIEPFLFSHNPIVNIPWFTWSGHIHPKVKLNGTDRLVLRCFYIEKDCAILPAFSDFTGGSFVYKSEKAEIYAIAGSNILKI